MSRRDDLGKVSKKLVQMAMHDKQELVKEIKEMGATVRTIEKEMKKIKRQINEFDNIIYKAADEWCHDQDRKNDNTKS
jgi:molybdopterin converting factor small subunit